MKFSQKIIDACPNSTILLSEDLSKHTTFEVGGAADYFIEPKTISAFITALTFLQSNNIPFFILGGGSNTVFSDRNFEGAIISTLLLNDLKADFTQLSKSSYVELFCGAGCTFEKICTFCEKNELTGLENFSGLPGTLGGAIHMNARCYDKEIADVLVSVEYFDLTDFKQNTYTFKKSDWSYKDSPFQRCKNHIVLQAVLHINSGTANEISEKNAHFLNDRKNRKQFDFPSAGSVFKNNRTFGMPSGKIIEQAGLRGTQVGGARVADWHGNFIINFSNASAEDIRVLNTLVVDSVKEQTGLTLENEILFVNFEEK